MPPKIALTSKTPTKESKSALEAKSEKKGKASHTDLNELAAGIGKRLRAKIEKEIGTNSPKIVKNSDGRSPLGEKVQKISEISEVPTGFFDSFLNDDNISRYSLEEKTSPIRTKFESNYRNELSGMDEFVSTSTVRELLTGMVKKEKLEPALRERLGELVDLTSVVRAPTKYVGFAVEAKDSATGKSREVSMQHPTEGGSKKTTALTKKRKADTTIGSSSKIQRTGGVFSDHKTTVTEHDELDAKRKESVLEAMDKALNEGKTAEEVVTIGVLDAIDFTLGNMMAPASASNVSGHIARKEEEQIQTSAREKMKKMADILNGKTRASQSTTSVWQGPGIGSDPKHHFKPTRNRSISPTRDPTFIEPKREPEPTVATALKPEPKPTVATALKPEPEPTVATVLKPEPEPTVATVLKPEAEPPVATALKPEPLLG